MLTGVFKASTPARLPSSWIKRNRVALLLQQNPFSRPHFPSLPRPHSETKILPKLERPFTVPHTSFSTTRNSVAPHTRFRRVHSHFTPNFLAYANIYWFEDFLRGFWRRCAGLSRELPQVLCFRRSVSLPTVWPKGRAHSSLVKRPFHPRTILRRTPSGLHRGPFGLSSLPQRDYGIHLPSRFYVRPVGGEVVLHRLGRKPSERRIPNQEALQTMRPLDWKMEGTTVLPDTRNGAYCFDRAPLHTSKGSGLYAVQAKHFEGTGIVPIYDDSEDTTGRGRGSVAHHIMLAWTGPPIPQESLQDLINDVFRKH